MSSVASLIRLKLIERAKRIDGSAPFHYDVGDRVRGAQAFVEQMADQLDAGNLPAIWVFRARDGGQVDDEIVRTGGTVDASCHHPASTDAHNCAAPI